jgi:hypothetical protein
MNVASAPSILYALNTDWPSICALFLSFLSPWLSIKLGRSCHFRRSYGSTRTPRVRSFVVLILVLKGRIAAHADVL